MKGSAKGDRALEASGTAGACAMAAGAGAASGRLEGLGLSVNLRTSTDPSAGRSGSQDDGSGVEAVDLGCVGADLGNPGWEEGGKTGVEGVEALIPHGASIPFRPGLYFILHGFLLAHR